MSYNLEMKIPELNAKQTVHFTFGHGGSGLGCQAGLLQNIHGQLLISAWGPINASKPCGIEVVKDGYYTKYKDDALVDFLVSPEGKIFRDQGYEFLADKIVKTCTGYGMYIGSSPTNLGSKERPGSVYFWNTMGMFQYLANNKIGLVHESVQFRNPSHSSSADTSLCRTWTWVPPSLVPYAYGRSKLYNRGSMVDIDTAAANYRKVVDKSVTVEEWAERLRSSANDPATLPGIIQNYYGKGKFSAY